MNNDNKVIERVVFEKLIPFGFTFNDENYDYRVGLGKTELDLLVQITLTGDMRTAVIDKETLEPYVLHQVSSAQGGFVGEVRAGIDLELKKIIHGCFMEQQYLQNQTQEIVSLIETNYGDSIEFLWQRTPKNGIFRRQDTKKWYVAILTVERVKLGLTGEGTIEIIDLRGEPAVISQLVDHRRYYPGYHMNKKHWYTICLDGSISTAEILVRIKISYDLANK